MIEIKYRFWDKINYPEMKEIPFKLQYPYQNSFKQFTAKVSLFGITYTLYPNTTIPNQNVLDHHAEVRINNTLIEGERITVINFTNDVLSDFKIIILIIFCIQ